METVRGHDFTENSLRTYYELFQKSVKLVRTHYVELIWISFDSLELTENTPRTH